MASTRGVGLDFYKGQPKKAKKHGFGVVPTKKRPPRAGGSWVSSLFILCVLGAITAGLYIGFAGGRLANYHVVSLLIVAGAVIGVSKAAPAGFEVMLATLVLLVVSQSSVFNSLNTIVNQLGTALNYVITNLAIFLSVAIIVPAIITVAKHYTGGGKGG